VRLPGVVLVLLTLVFPAALGWSAATLATALVAVRWRAGALPDRPVQSG
jgi:hypothetical protein